MRHQQHLFVHGRHRDELGLVHRKRDEAHVRCACANLLQQPLRRTGDQLYFHGGVLPPVFLQQRGKHIHADGHASGQPQSPADDLLALADQRDGFFDVSEHAVTKLNKRIPGRRNPNPAAHAQEDRLVHLLFEQENLTADRRLRHVQLPPGAGKRPGLCDRLHDLELAQIHGQMISQSQMHKAQAICMSHASRRGNTHLPRPAGTARVSLRLSGHSQRRPVAHRSRRSVCAAHRSLA